jgi:opacity protein-like surface antigen
LVNSSVFSGDKIGGDAWIVGGEAVESPVLSFNFAVGFAMKTALSFAWPLLLLSTAAARADGVAAPMPADWNGFYVGATAAAQLSSSHFALPGDTGDALQQTRANRASVLGGGIAGYNDQIGAMVLGVEADVSSGGGTSSVTACTVPDGCFTPTHDSFTTLNHLSDAFNGRLRARLGWADGYSLFYAAAGYSYADTKLSLVGLCYNPGDPTVPLVFNFDRARNLSGFNLGVGVDQALGAHWVVRAEFVFDDYGNQTYPGAAPEWNDRRISVIDSTLRVAVGYRF